MKSLRDYEFFKTDGGVLYKGDCMEVLPLIEKTHLCFTSPPYNTGGKNLGGQPNSTVGQSFYGDNYKDNLAEKTYIDWQINLVKLLLEKSYYSFYVIMFMTTTKNNIITLMDKYRENLKDVHFWEKQAPCAIQKGVCAKGVEWILCFGQDKKFLFDKHNFPPNGYIKNINTFFKKVSFKEHHATFPVELAAHYIENYSKPGETILDPFMGSGTTAVAAEKLGRKWVGIELAENYCNLIKERIEKERSQIKLF